MSKKKNIEFINPYNFFPIKNELRTANKENVQQKNKKYTGYIAYSLLTKTPMFIPNTSNEDAFDIGIDDHKSYDFFSYTDLSSVANAEKQYDSPVIPGSEIRGMIRSNFEILTNSCLANVDGDKYIPKRTMEIFTVGLIKKEGKRFSLVKAEDYLWRTKGKNNEEDIDRKKANWDDPNYYTLQSYIQSKYQEGDAVYFTYVKRGSKVKPLATNVSKQSGKNRKKVGYIMKGEEGPQNPNRTKKHCCHIFVPLNETGKIEQLDEKNILQLRRVLDSYKEMGEHAYSEYTAVLEEFLDGNGNDYFPVYYSLIRYNDEKSKQLFLAPAVFTKEIGNSNIESRFGEMKACISMENLCPTCSLFGTMNDSVNNSSRVRFTDLLCEEKEIQDCFEKPITLYELSSPKYNLEFYFQRPEDAVFWTFDYYFDIQGNVHRNNSGINGRKFYWHDLSERVYGQSIQITRLEKDEEKLKELKRRSTVRPVKAGKMFSGKVYFENITKKELDLLLYVMYAGENASVEINDKKHGYKLGAGKPLGMGSVAIRPDEIKIINYSHENGKLCRKTSDYRYENVQTISIDKERLQDYYTMTDFEALKELQKKGCVMQYPAISKASEGYEWFVKNHAGYDRKKGEEIEVPRTRKAMIYKEYMIPMQMELEKINLSEIEHQQENATTAQKGKNVKRRENSEKIEVLFLSYDNIKKEIIVDNGGEKLSILVSDSACFKYANMKQKTPITVKRSGKRYEAMN